MRRERAANCAETFAVHSDLRNEFLLRPRLRFSSPEPSAFLCWYFVCLF